MCGAERFVFAPDALGESQETAALTQRADARAPAGQDLVGIGLTAESQINLSRGVSNT